MNIGDKIRKIRSLKGFSQENMADALDISLVAYGDIERNKKDISLKRLTQIAMILNITIIDILLFNNNISIFFPQPNTNAQSINRNPKEIEHKLEIALLEIEKLKIE